jgi:hypothetical protein
MTSAIGAVGLTFDGTDLQPSDLSVFLQIVHGLNETPSVRGVDVVVPALAGRVEANRVNDVLPIVLEGFCRADPSTTTTEDARESYRTNQRALRTLFASNRERADLVATLEDGSELVISARPQPGMIWNENVISEFATISIELEGYDDWAIVGS